MTIPLNRRLSITIIVIVSISLSGCYTLLKHPPTTEPAEREDFNKCFQCHGGYFHPGPFDPFYSNPWWDYYILPWWYDNIIIVTDEGEVPGRRLIHERSLQHRDTGIGINPIVPKRISPPVPETGDETTKEGDDIKVKESPGRKSSDNVQKRPVSKDKSPKKRDDKKKKTSETWWLLS